MLINPLFLQNLAGAYFVLAVIGVLMVATFVYASVWAVKLWRFTAPVEAVGSDA